MPATPLSDVRGRVEAGEFELSPDVQLAVVSRIDDLITAVTAANRALSKLPQPAVPEAAAKMASLYYISGHGWQRYLADNSQASTVGSAVRGAMQIGVAALVAQLSNILESGQPAPVTRRGDKAFSLPCAACGGDAVTLSKAATSPVEPEQLVVSSLSPVTVFRPVAGPRMGDVIALLEAGNAAAVVAHLRETQPGGCDAFCEKCNRLFCRDHYAIEAQWSGSWHEATYVTCPLGHEHEID
ncbi:MAG: hypothetical protein O2973_04555 [Gemmatimonadetes bacterium]|nr:hypothetical protein [Gemmatimonadota bacterium]